MAMKAACSKFQFNLNNLFKLNQSLTSNQCLTTRVGFCRGFLTTSAKKGEFSPPKRPPNAFLLFSMNERASVKKENPDMIEKDIKRLMGQRWKDVESSEKKKYEKEYVRRKEEYEEQRKIFEESLTDEQLEELQKKKTGKETGKKKKRYEGLNKPTKTTSSFNFYIKDVCSGFDRIPFGQAAKQFADLSPEEKMVYEKQNEQDKIRYEKEMEEWEQKMEEIGRTDVIRKKKK